MSKKKKPQKKNLNFFFYKRKNVFNIKQIAINEKKE